MNKEINMDEATLALRETLSHDYQLFFFNKMSFILYSKLLVYEITTFYYIYMSCRAVCGYFQVMLIWSALGKNRSASVFGHLVPSDQVDLQVLCGSTWSARSFLNFKKFKLGF